MQSRVPKIDPATIARTIVLFFALINGVLAMLGMQLIPVGEADVENAVNAIYATISAVALVVAALITWWKNNNFTKKARLKEQRSRNIR